MNLERAIRARQIKDYTKGEKVFCPEEFYEEGILSTQQRKGHIKVNFERSQDFPKSLVLRTRLTPIPFQTMETQARDYPSEVQHVINNNPKHAVHFYKFSSIYSSYEDLGKMSWHKAVELRYHNFGLSENKPFQGNTIDKFKIILGPNNLIFRKNFHVQTKMHLIQPYIIMNPDHWIVTDPHGHTKTNGTPLLAYGGAYRPGLAAEKIVPTFAVISSHHDTTHLKLYSLTVLKERHVKPPEGGICGISHWYFADNLPITYFMSLAESLQKGFAEVVLEDQKTQETCRYISKDFKNVGTENTELDITFMPKSKKGD